MGLLYPTNYPKGKGKKPTGGTGSFMRLARLGNSGLMLGRKKLKIEN
jgi:hypothetical protein